MKHKRDIILKWIDKVETEGVNLTVWEENFIESIKERMIRNREISDRQEEILEKIYSEKTP